MFHLLKTSLGYLCTLSANGCPALHGVEVDFIHPEPGSINAELFFFFPTKVGIVCGVGLMKWMTKY